MNWRRLGKYLIYQIKKLFTVQPVNCRRCGLCHHTCRLLPKTPRPAETEEK